MYRSDDTQPIFIDQQDTMVFAHPGTAAEHVNPGVSAAQRVLYVLLAVLLFAAGGVAGGFLVTGSTFTQGEVDAQRTAAEQAGYDAGYEDATADAEAGAKDQASRAYNDGYRDGFEAGLEQGAALAPQAGQEQNEQPDAEQADSKPGKPSNKD